MIQPTANEIFAVTLTFITFIMLVTFFVMDLQKTINALIADNSELRKIITIMNIEQCNESEARKIIRERGY